MNAKKYSQLLIHHTTPSGKSLIDNRFILQHDGEPKLTANAVDAHLNIQTKELHNTNTKIVQIHMIVFPPVFAYSNKSPHLFPIFYDN